MGTRTLTLEMPEEIVALLGSSEGAAAKARAALVIELLREARIGQGMAAELLRLTRGEILDLIVERHIPPGPETAEEASRELEDLRRFFTARASHDGDQR